MPSLVEQAAKSIFHGTGGCGKNMGFHGRQVDNVLPNKAFGNKKSALVNPARTCAVMSLSTPGPIKKGGMHRLHPAFGAQG